MEKERGLDLGFDGSSLRQVAVILGVVFVVALAVMVGKRMSADALAIVVGIAVGMVATLPPTLLLLVVLLRRERPARENQEQAYPPVVILQGGAPQALPPGMPQGYWPSGAMGPHGSQPERYFEVVGGDDLLEGEWTVMRDR
jgi:hypothetical protein